VGCDVDGFGRCGHAVGNDVERRVSTMTEPPAIIWAVAKLFVCRVLCMF
jgi:hypothetical protein